MGQQVTLRLLDYKDFADSPDGVFEVYGCLETIVLLWTLQNCLEV